MIAIFIFYLCVIKNNIKPAIVAKAVMLDIKRKSLFPGLVMLGGGVGAVVIIATGGVVGERYIVGTIVGIIVGAVVGRLTVGMAVGIEVGLNICVTIGVLAGVVLGTTVGVIRLTGVGDLTGEGSISAKLVPIV